MPQQQQYKYNLRVRSHFEASHTLDWHNKCSALHGHTYHVEVVIGANQLDPRGIVMDLTVIKNILNFILPDHRHLNDWITNPTVERIAESIGIVIDSNLVELGYKRHQARIIEVTVWETPTGGVTVLW